MCLWDWIFKTRKWNKIPIKKYMFIYFYFLIIKINQGLFRRPYPGSTHPEWLPNLEGPIILINENILATTHTRTLSTIRVKTSFETYSSIISQRLLKISLKAFIAPFSLTIIAIKDHNTISSFKTQLQRETLASESLISTSVITLQLTWIMQHNNSRTKNEYVFVTLAK